MKQWKTSMVTDILTTSKKEILPGYW